MTDLKLGILLFSQAATWEEQLDAAKRIDRLGYAHLWTWDHLYAIFGDPYQPIFEGWSALAAWAMATEQTRLGRLGKCHPPVHRPRAAQVDPRRGAQLLEPDDGRVRARGQRLAADRRADVGRRG